MAGGCSRQQFVDNTTMQALHYIANKANTRSAPSILSKLQIQSGISSALRTHIRRRCQRSKTKHSNAAPEVPRSRQCAPLSVCSMHTRAAAYNRRGLCVVLPTENSMQAATVSRAVRWLAYGVQFVLLRDIGFLNPYFCLSTLCQ
jgi:hypothetical protein